MNYHAIYNRLIDRARARQSFDGYTERHHVVPKCVGGDDEPGNIVILTAEEHYIAHQLLVRMHPGNGSLVWAAVNMTGKARNNAGRRNKLYGWLRRRFAAAISERHAGKAVSAEAREKMAAAKRGRKRGPHSEEHRRKLSEAAKGRKRSEAHRAALSAALTGKKRGPQSEAHRRAISEGNKVAAKRRDNAWQARDAEHCMRQAERMKEVWDKRRAGILPAPRRNRSSKRREIRFHY
jgi:hypothetical protein